MWYESRGAIFGESGSGLRAVEGIAWWMLLGKSSCAESFRGANTVSVAMAGAGVEELSVSGRIGCRVQSKFPFVSRCAGCWHVLRERFGPGGEAVAPPVGSVCCEELEEEEAEAEVIEG